MRSLLPSLILSFLPFLLAATPTTRPTPWLGLHVIVDSASRADDFISSIPSLEKEGVTTLLIETDYSFDFPSHPELAGPTPVTRAQAHAIASLCRQHHIRPIPEINCLGHQSWAKNTLSLLAQHPDLDETPGKFPDNTNPDPKGEKFYCRSWCPSNPALNQLLFPLIDDLLDAFEADAFHVGMDEVFVLADKDCPRCSGKDPAQLFAAQVNSFHHHLVDEKHVQMFMWADRLLDAKRFHLSKWEASANGTAPAIDLIPKDIVLCDWHYSKQQGGYPSVQYLLDKGFPVWPTGWNDPAAVTALVDYSLALHHPQMLGYLSTTWNHVPVDKLADFPPTKIAAEKLHPASRTSPTIAPRQ